MLLTRASMRMPGASLLYTSQAPKSRDATEPYVEAPIFALSLARDAQFTFVMIEAKHFKDHFRCRVECACTRERPARLL